MRAKETENTAPPAPLVPRTKLLRTLTRELFSTTITHHQPPPRPPGAVEETGTRNGGTLRLRVAAAVLPEVSSGAACGGEPNLGLIRAASPGVRARVGETEDAAPPTSDTRQAGPHIKSPQESP
ncbi:hypothetical protein NDU88_003426 [Pleurodeles waltl]|uniref:Uncharacterized protein n=1 Tax=Pleurodeles waltl TaxID=8319 RepID=A0AAV7WRE2_PLEWA|nr:hypothetical protein NDU88_003426 [Pleurodeles waltl]